MKFLRGAFITGMIVSWVCGLSEWACVTLFFLGLIATAMALATIACDYITRGRSHAKIRR